MSDEIEAVLAEARELLPQVIATYRDSPLTLARRRAELDRDAWAYREKGAA